MKNYKIKILFHLILIILYSNSALQAGCDFNNAFFALSDNNWKFLHYFKFTNNFDTVTVNYEIGEFKISNINNTITPFIKDLNINSNFWIMGDSLQGEDLILLPKSRTETFNYFSGSQISFFRMMSVMVPCWATFEGEGAGGSGGGSYQDAVFNVGGANRIMDDNEWVLQLVRASNNQVLFSIDSVGINQNHNSVIAQYYGTQPDHINRSVNLPDNFASIPVYLRISTRRTGDTPYGMELKYTQSNISKSTFFEYSDSNQYYLYKCSQLDIKQLDSIYFNKLITFCDSVFNVNGTLSFNYARRIDISDSANSRIFWYKYFQPIDTNSNGLVFFKETIPEVPHANDVKHNFNGLIFGNDYGLIKMTASPLPITDSRVELKLISKKYFENCYLDIYGQNGEKITSLKFMNIDEGESKITLDLNLYPGFYFIVARSQDKNLLGYTKIIVSK